MAMPSGFHSFTHYEKSKSGDLPTRYLFAYKPPGALQTGKLDDLMLALCVGPSLPDAAVIVGIKGNNEAALLEKLSSESSAIAQQRIVGRIPLFYAGYDPVSGQVEVKLLDRTFDGKVAEFKKVIGKKVSLWIRSGLESIFEYSKVVLKAPGGYAFQNPSGLRTQLFLKPDLALTSPGIYRSRTSRSKGPSVRNAASRSGPVLTTCVVVARRENVCCIALEMIATTMGWSSAIRTCMSPPPEEGSFNMPDPKNVFVI